jgi:hypothetical protein
MVRGRTTAPSGAQNFHTPLTIFLGMVLGHEITGEVVEVGRDVEFVSVGDIVSVPFNIACGRSVFTMLFHLIVPHIFQSSCLMFMGYMQCLSTVVVTTASTERRVSASTSTPPARAPPTAMVPPLPAIAPADMDPAALIYMHTLPRTHTRITLINTCTYMRVYYI